MAELEPGRFIVDSNNNRVVDRATRDWFVIHDRDFSEHIDIPFRKLPSKLIAHFVETKGAENVRILEVAYGKGTRAARDIVTMFPGVHVVTTDVMPGSPEEIPGVERVPSDFANLPFEDGSFDLVLSRGFLVGLEEGPGFEEEKRNGQQKARSAMREMVRVLADGGVALVQDSKFIYLPDRHPELQSLEDDLRFHSLDQVYDLRMSRKDGALFLDFARRLDRLFDNPSWLQPSRMLVIQKGSTDPKTQKVIDSVPTHYPRWRTR